MTQPTITIDGQSIPFKEGQTIMEAATAADVYIPHLCYKPDLPAHGSCRLCMVSVNGRMTPACLTKAEAGQEVLNNTKEIQSTRRALTRMLFVEGNHICPGCPKTGNCQLQGVAYYVGMLSSHYQHFYPYRELDASHPNFLVDFNRCILCELCVRASRDMDKKNVFALSGRGIKTHLVINSPSGELGDTNYNVDDRAAMVCPVGSILRRRVRYTTPIGERLYDQQPINIVGDSTQPHAGAKRHAKK